MSIGKSSLFLLPEVMANLPGRQRSEGDLNSMYRAISMDITVSGLNFTAQMMDDLMYGRGSVGGPFTLTDQTGKPRSDSEFRGKLMIRVFRLYVLRRRVPDRSDGHYPGARRACPRRYRCPACFHHDRSGAGHP